MSRTDNTEPGKPPFGFASRVSRVSQRAGSFWERVSEGLELQELWRQFVTEARASYALYAHEVHPTLGEQSGWRRWFSLLKALFWAMMMKLSPARRVFLLIALILIVIALVSGQAEGQDRRGFFLLGAGALVALLALELADRVSMKRDLEIAREIQRWLVPETPPQVPGVDIAFATRPANTVAGDYYDAFLRTTDGAAPQVGPLLVVVADVAGKSVPAALLMATFQASLQTLAAAPSSLLDLVAGLNRYACMHSLGGLRFTTAFLAELEPGSRRITYVCAGHNAPMLRRASGKIERLEAGGMPLGISADAHFDQGECQLDAGDVLVIFTDGVIEAENDRKEEYGEARLTEVLRNVPRESAADTLKRLMSDVDAFVGTARQRDDLTCLILRAA